MIDTRRYQWMIGIFGLVLVVAISVFSQAISAELGLNDVEAVREP